MPRLSTCLLGLVSLLGASCATEDVAVQLDFATNTIFLYADTIELSLHEVPDGMTPINACEARSAELQGGGFMVPPVSLYGPYGACEFFHGVELGGLRSSETLFLADVRDATGRIIALGCEPETLVELPASMDEVPRITIPLRTTTYYNNEVQINPPAFDSIELKCGM